MPNDNSQNTEDPKPDTQSAFGTPTPQFSPSTPPFNSPKPRVSKKALIAILGVVGIVVLVAIAFTTAYLLSRISEPDSDQESNNGSLTLQLTELYKGSSSDIDQDVTLGDPTVQDSGTIGYKNAQALILGTEAENNEFAYFYQTSDETWHFFATATNQDLIECGIYNTEDLINAYVGFTCQDTEGPSYVQLEQPEFEVVPGSIGE